MIRLVPAIIMQKYKKQELRRKPEQDMIMYEFEQDEQYTHDGEHGSLAILYNLVINSLMQIAPPQGEALDICCGSAQLLSGMADAMPEIHFTGLDLSPNMLNFARKSRDQKGVTNLDFKEGSMYELDSYFDKKFDLITWNLALHHCETDENVITVMNHINRLIKPDGTIWIFDIIRPKTGKLALLYAKIFNSFEGDWYFQDSLDSYKAAFTFEELGEIASLSNLENCAHVEPYFANFHQVIYRSKHNIKSRKPYSTLNHLWQHRDYLVLKLAFNGLIKGKP